MPTARAPRGSRTAHPCGPAVPPRPAPHLLLLRAVLTSPLPSSRGTGLFIYLPIHLLAPFIYLFDLWITPHPFPPSRPLGVSRRWGRGGSEPPATFPAFLPRPLPAREHHRAGVYITAPRRRRRPPGTPRIPHRGGPAGVVGGGRGSAQPGPAPRARSGPPRRAEQRPSRRRKWALY